MKKPNTYIVNIIFFTIFLFFSASYQMEKMAQKGLSHTNFVKILNMSKESFMKKPNQLLEGFSLIIEYIEKYKISDGKEFLQKIQKASLEKQWRIFEEMQGKILSNKMYSPDFHNEFTSRMQNYPDEFNSLLKPFSKAETSKEKIIIDTIINDYFKYRDTIENYFITDLEKTRFSLTRCSLHVLYPFFFQQDFQDPQNEKQEKKICGIVAEAYNKLLCAKAYYSFFEALTKEKNSLMEFTIEMSQFKKKSLGQTAEINSIKGGLSSKKTNTFLEKFEQTVQQDCQRLLTIYGGNNDIKIFFSSIGGSCQEALHNFCTNKNELLCCISPLYERSNDIKKQLNLYPCEFFNTLTHRAKTTLRKKFYLTDKKNLTLNQKNNHPFNDIYDHTIAVFSANRLRELLQAEDIEKRYPFFFEKKGGAFTLQLQSLKNEYDAAKSLFCAELEEIYHKRNAIVDAMKALQKKIDGESELTKKINAIRRNIADQERLKVLENDLTSLQGNAHAAQINIITDQINAIRARLQNYAAEYGQNSLVSNPKILLALLEEQYFKSLQACIPLDDQSNQKQSENYEDLSKNLQEWQEKQKTTLDTLEEQINATKKLFQNRWQTTLETQSKKLFPMWIHEGLEDSLMNIRKAEFGIRLAGTQENHYFLAFNHNLLVEYDSFLKNYSNIKAELLNDTSEKYIPTKTQLILNFLTTTEQLCAETITEFKKTHNYFSHKPSSLFNDETYPVNEYKNILAALEKASQDIQHIIASLHASAESQLINAVYEGLPISCPNTPDSHTMMKKQSFPKTFCCKNILNLKEKFPNLSCKHCDIFFPFDRLKKLIKITLGGRQKRIHDYQKNIDEQNLKGFHANCEPFQKLITLLKAYEEDLNFMAQKASKSYEEMPEEICACSDIIKKYVEEN